jgi:tetratricopeptide (TPR) repeat protein
LWARLLINQLASAMEEAEALKAQGNAALQANDFTAAIQHYSAAIALDPSSHVYFSNRSVAFLSSGDKEAALADGQSCVDLKSDWSKGHGRKGAALHALGRWGDAVSAYAVGLEHCPGDESLTSALVAAAKARDAAATVAAVAASSTLTPVGGGEQGGEQWRVQAEEFKTHGNAAFKNGEHEQAVEFYGKAIALDPDNHVLYSNRCGSMLDLGFGFLVELPSVIYL